MHTFKNVTNNTSDVSGNEMTCNNDGQTQYGMGEWLGNMFNNYKNN